MSLALEGGFPTRLLESRENGTIATHLRTLLARLETHGTIDEDEAIAASHSSTTNLRSYDHEEFHVLCAELCLALLALKREAQAKAPSGVSATAWLDGMTPSWRETLPIGLTGEGGKRLLDDLISARAERIVGDAVCRRLLLFRDGGWVPGMVLGMTGGINIPRGIAEPSAGRLRVYSAGALASVLVGELGLLEPPTEEGDHWLCRPRGGRDHRGPFPFELPTSVELRSGELIKKKITWPRGESLRSELLIFADDRGDEAVTPASELAYLGASSLRTRRGRVYLLTPTDFVVTALESGESLEPIWQGERQLFEVTFPVRAGAGNGDFYRVEVGADGERVEQLEVRGQHLRGAEAVDSRLAIYAGRPLLRTRINGRTESPKSGQIQWRGLDNSIWKDWVAQPPADGMGLVEVVWKDPKSRAMRDRCTFAILPEGAAIKPRPSGKLGVAYEVEGMGDWTLALAETGGVQSEPEPGCLNVWFDAKPRRRLSFALHKPHGTPISISCTAPLRDGGFASSDDALLPTHAKVMLDDVRGAVAFADGREWLYLRGPAGGGAHFAFSDELPLWSLSEEITRLLGAGSGLDDEVVAELGQFGGAKLTIGRYAAQVMVSGGEVSVAGEPVPKDLANTRNLEWLSICRPETRILARRSWAERLTHPTEPLPDDLEGPGLILLREGDRVIGRPTLTIGQAPRGREAFSDLQKAALIQFQDDRYNALDEALSRLSQSTPAAARDRDYLVSLVTALNGVPPVALDVLKRLALTSSAQAALIGATTDEDARALVWKLERELPFMWALVPVGDWADAFAAQSAALVSALIKADVEGPQATEIAASSVARAVEQLADLDPLLRTPLAFAGFSTAEARTAPLLFDSAQDRIRRTAYDDDRMARPPKGASVDPASLSCFRATDSPVREHLPDFTRFDPSQWEGLDAPCAAALAAAGHAKLKSKMMGRIRAALAEEPLSFADMYAASLTLLAHHRPLNC